MVIYPELMPKAPDTSVVKRARVLAETESAQSKINYQLYNFCQHTLSETQIPILFNGYEYLCQTVIE